MRDTEQMVASQTGIVIGYSNKHAVLGHKDIKTALRYAHLVPAHKKNTINVLDTLLAPSPNITPATNFTITSQSTKKESAESANSLI